jgi:hypothetical protein
MSRDGRRKLGDWAVAMVVALIAIVVTWGAAEVRRQGDQLDRQSETVDVLAQALGDEQSAAEARGEDPVAPPADDLIENPEYTPAPGPPGPTGPPGPGPSQEAIDAAVARHFAEHPYQGELSAAELAAAFAALLAENPGAIDDQVYAALASYLAENPPPPGPPGADGADGKDGTDGAQGEPGRPPTQEEIRAEVEAYVAEHGLPICPEGSSPQAHTILTDSGPIDAVICVETEPTE